MLYYIKLILYVILKLYFNKIIKIIENNELFNIKKRRYR